MIKKKETKLIVENWRNFINESKEETDSQRRFREYHKKTIDQRTIIQFVADGEGLKSLNSLGLNIDKNIPIFQLEDKPVILNCLIVGVFIDKPDYAIDNPEDPVGLGYINSTYFCCWLDGKGTSGYHSAYEPFVKEINDLFDKEWDPEYGETQLTSTHYYSNVIKLFNTGGMRSFQEYPDLKGVYFVSRRNNKLKPLAYDGSRKTGMAKKCSDITVF